MRRQKLKYNTIANLAYNAVTLICGFILPRYILSTYGSEVNGLVNSITRFLSFITFFEFGVGAVVRSGLYEPLAKKDDVLISQIIVSSDKFFKQLARVLIIYIVVLLILYPMVVDNQYGFMYTDLLIIAISINLFAQYYFGKTNEILVTADQKGYIYLTIESLSMITNTAVCIILMRFGLPIQVVKGATSLIFLARPLLLFFYVKKNYNIDRHINLEREPLPQKKNGIAQHIANFVLDGTDTIVLTLFSTLYNVSIYNIYYLVVNGIRSLSLALSNGMQSLFGEMIAKKEDENLVNYFGWYEWLSHSVNTVLFGCCAVLIVPFVLVYTSGINDANYNVPTFGILITIAIALHCLCIPYNIMILAANIYKETQKYFIIAAIINVVLSVVLVLILGIEGVAIGTLVAMLYESIWMIIYNSKYLINWPIRKTIKQYIVDFIVFAGGYYISSFFGYTINSYLSWVRMGACVFVVFCTIWLLVNILLYREYFQRLIKKLSSTLKT